MKKAATLIVMLFMALTTFSQDCNIGNQTSDPNFNAGNFAPYYLLGVKFTLSEAGVLYSLNILGNGTGASFQMAMYNDNGGVPNNLVTYTSISNVGSGIVSLPVTPEEIPAGDYWIMAVYDDNGSDSNHSDVNTSATNTVYYNDLPFGNPIPANASGFQSYPGQDFLYFAVINCGSMSVPDLDQNNISVTPNPARDFIVFSNLTEPSLFQIYDLTGKKLIDKKLSTTDNKIDISQLSQGLYIINYNNQLVSKFVKE